jgi:hypothetical protein
MTGHPSPANIALAPELAILHVLDAALAMSVETLVAAHCDLANSTCPEERLAKIIADQSRRLRRIITSYSETVTNHHVSLVDI